MELLQDPIFVVFGVVVIVVAGLITKQFFERKCKKNKDKITHDPTDESAKKRLAAEESQLTPLKETQDKKSHQKESTQNNSRSKSQFVLKGRPLGTIHEDEENKASIAQEE